MGALIHTFSTHTQAHLAQNPFNHKPQRNQLDKNPPPSNDACDSAVCKTIQALRTQSPNAALILHISAKNYYILIPLPHTHTRPSSGL